MEKIPQVSIIIPFYNRAEVIGATIESILQQTYRDFELICVDDGSTDNVPIILANYANKDSRVKIISKKHTNIGDSRNIGYQHSSGAYVFFLDSDDLYHVQFIEKMVWTLEHNACDLVICGCEFFDHGTELQLLQLQTNNVKNVKIKTLTEKNGLSERIFSLGSALIRRAFKRQIIEQYNIHFQSMDCSCDHLFVFNYTYVILQNKGILSITNEPLVWHRVNDINSVSNIRNQNRDLYCICRAMDAVRNCIKAKDWPRVQGGFQQYFFIETCYALVRSNYKNGKRIFQYARANLKPIGKIQIKPNRNRYRTMAHKLYKFCLIFNQFWIFSLAKNIMLKFTQNKFKPSAQKKCSWHKK